MITTTLRKFLAAEDGAIQMDAISMAAAGVGLTIAFGAVVMVGNLSSDADQSSDAVMGLHGPMEYTSAPTSRTPERLNMITVLPTRTATECAPLYDGGPVACSTAISHRCELWQMTDGGQQEFCTRL